MKRFVKIILHPCSIALLLYFVIAVITYILTYGHCELEACTWGDVYDPGYIFSDEERFHMSAGVMAIFVPIIILMAFVPIVLGAYLNWYDRQFWWAVNVHHKDRRFVRCA